MVDMIDEIVHALSTFSWFLFSDKVGLADEGISVKTQAVYVHNM